MPQRSCVSYRRCCSLIFSKCAPGVWQARHLGMILNRLWVTCLLDYYKTNARCFLKFDKLIVDDNAYIYNDMEGRVEKLPHKVGLWWGWWMWWRWLYEHFTKRSTHSRTKTSYFLVTLGAMWWFLGPLGPQGIPLVVSLIVLPQEKSDHKYMGM